MQRRKFLLASAAALLSWPATAQIPGLSPGTSPRKPYREVMQVPGDRDRVMSFFLMTCPFCRQMHEQIDAWGASLPAPMSFEFVPVVTADPETVIAARAYYAALQAGPSVARTFVSAAYRATQDRRMAVSDPETWRRIAMVAGIGDQLPMLWRRVPAEKVSAAGRRLAAYHLDSTPSIAVGGRYVVTPDDVEGNTALFMQLASGMVSKYLMETGRAAG